MNREHENLEELLSTFMSKEEAGIFAGDIAHGEQLLADNPAPEPSQELLAMIKSRMNTHAAVRRVSRRVYFGQLVAAASVLLLVIVLAAMHLGGSPTQTPVDYVANGTYPDFYTAAAEDIAYIAGELDLIEESFVSIDLVESADYLFLTLQEFEADIDELEATLWKG